MKITSTREKILEPLQRVAKLAGKHATLPILSCVLFVVKEKTLTLRGTNLETGLEYTLPVEAEGEGVFALPQSVIVPVIAALPGGSALTLCEGEGGVVVEGVRSRARLATQDPSDFPTLPRVEQGTTVSIALEDMRAVVESVSFCSSLSTIKPELASVFVHADGSELVAAATDSFRLSEKKRPQKRSSSCEPFLLPAKSIPDFLRALEGDSNNTIVTVSQHQLSLTSPTSYFTMRLTPGVFPDYAKIIPTTFHTEVTLLKYDIEQTLKKTTVFSGKDNQVVLTVDPKQNTITLSAQSAEVGEFTEELHASIEGKPLTIKFNQHYLTEAFGPIVSDSVVLSFGGEGQPLVVRGMSDASFRYLVMPMNR